MKLTLSKRAGEKKSELTQIRHRKDIPAILYISGKAGAKVTVKGAEFHAIIRKLHKGYLPTTIFSLDFEGKEKRAIVKDIQYHPATYEVFHLDFLELDDKTPVDIKVPLLCIGEAECIGIKLGGFLRQIKRHIKVRCLPKDIPSDFKLDIKELEINQSKRVRDLDVKEGVCLLVPQDEVVVVIAKR
jgi:large subunit ribosomal protein L25